ncbi:hypothetical protein DV736_g3505, partial [Chaetothyriales sp. CBS 134916]
MPLDTTIHSGFITDLIVPREGTCGCSAAELEQLSYDTALEILHDFPAFIRANPLVTHVERIDASHTHFIDVPAFRSLFGGLGHHDRFESFTNPGSGVKMHGTFDLYRSPDVPGVVNFIERNETKYPAWEF